MLASLQVPALPAQAAVKWKSYGLRSAVTIGRRVATRHVVTLAAADDEPRRVVDGGLPR